MRIAEEFIASLSKSKTDPRVRFENAQQLLLDNFTELLSADAASPMDESNPVFAAVAQYVDGRSYRALADSLPKPRFGGKTYERDGVKGKRKVPSLEDATQAALDIWTPLLAGLQREGLKYASFTALPATGVVSIETLRGILTDLVSLIRAEKK